MVQTFIVVRCFSCNVFQVQQSKKVNKFVCKLCNEKQSIQKVLFRGSSGVECRRHVQELNMRLAALPGTGSRSQRPDDRDGSVYREDDDGNEDAGHGYGMMESDSGYRATNTATTVSQSVTAGHVSPGRDRCAPPPPPPRKSKWQEFLDDDDDAPADDVSGVVMSSSSPSTAGSAPPALVQTYGSASGNGDVMAGTSSCSVIGRRHGVAETESKRAALLPWPRCQDQESRPSYATTGSSHSPPSAKRQYPPNGSTYRTWHGCDDFSHPLAIHDLNPDTTVTSTTSSWYATALKAEHIHTGQPLPSTATSHSKQRKCGWTMPNRSLSDAAEGESQCSDMDMARLACTAIGSNPLCGDSVQTSGIAEASKGAESEHQPYTGIASASITTHTRQPNSNTNPATSALSKALKRVRNPPQTAVLRTCPGAADSAGSGQHSRLMTASTDKESTKISVCGDTTTTNTSSTSCSAVTTVPGSVSNCITTCHSAFSRSTHTENTTAFSGNTHAQHRCNSTMMSSTGTHTAAGDQQAKSLFTVAGDIDDDDWDL